MEVPCITGDAEKIRSANYETVLKWRIFSCSDRVSFYATKIHFAGESGNRIHFSMANGTFKMKMDIDRHGPRLMPNNCKNLNPPYFSLPITFNSVSP
jgi:hypothetical protein